MGGLPLRFLGKPLRGDGLILPLRLRDGSAFPANGEDRERALSLLKVPALLPGRATRLARPSDPFKGEGDLETLAGQYPWQQIGGVARLPPSPSRPSGLSRGRGTGASGG